MNGKSATASNPEGVRRSSGHDNAKARTMHEDEWHKQYLANHKKMGLSLDKGSYGPVWVRSS